MEKRDGERYRPTDRVKEWECIGDIWCDEKLGITFQSSYNHAVKLQCVLLQDRKSGKIILFRTLWAIDF